MTEIKGQIGFQQIGLGGILKQYRLKVPPNQREYSWTEKEVTTLLQDLNKAIADQEKEYFLGTIVTIPLSPDLLEIVDGQQRLATTAILLSEIRNYLQDKEPIIAESITNGFLTDIDRDKRERVERMQLNVDDDEYFRRRLRNEAPPPTTTRHSHDLIDNAFKTTSAHLRQLVAGFNIKDHGDILNKWIAFIEHRATVILLKVSSDVNAYRMFETLNDRGLKTSQADLVKNYLFGQSGERMPEAQQKWALMRGALETLDEDDITVTFLRYALIAIRGYLTEPAVYEAVRAQAKGASASIAFLNSLEVLATIYVALFNPEHEKWNAYPDSIRRAIETLNLLNIKPLRPLMLAVAMHFSPEEANEAFAMFISWGVRLLIASSTRSGSVEIPLATAASLVFSVDISSASSLKAQLKDVIPNDSQFRQAFEVATVSKAALARYYLRSLEVAAQRGATPWFIPNDDRQTINLEHVLPEKPQGNWPHFNDEAVKAYAKKIGNLALLLARANSDLKSESFDTKKAIYAQTPYVLTKQIANLNDWTEASIADRQKELARLALSAWPL